MFLLLFGLYCCIVVAAREDRLLEELERKGRQDAGGGKRIEGNMRRISPRTVLTVTSGIAGNGNVQRNAVIIFCRKNGRIAPAEKMGCVETVRSALMDGTLPVLATACRRFFKICVSAARSEGKKVI